MNRENLRKLLDEAGVNPRFYSLDGPARWSESYSLVSDGSIYRVLYKERGEFTEVAGDLSEEEACTLIFQSLRDDLTLATTKPTGFMGFTGNGA